MVVKIAPGAAGRPAAATVERVFNILTVAQEDELLKQVREGARVCGHACILP